jgi:hypothetical protein
MCVADLAVCLCVCPPASATRVVCWASRVSSPPRWLRWPLTCLQHVTHRWVRGWVVLLALGVLGGVLWGEQRGLDCTGRVSQQVLVGASMKHAVSAFPPAATHTPVPLLSPLTHTHRLLPMLRASWER